jgi:hypothetical protein
LQLLSQISFSDHFFFAQINAVLHLIVGGFLFFKLVRLLFNLQRPQRLLLILLPQQVLFLPFQLIQLFIRECP